MNPKSPKRAELKSLAEENHFTLTGEELDIFPEAAANIILSFRRLDELSSLLGHKEIKRSGHLPTREENPLGAWAWKCSIKTSAEGKLAGKKIAIKDNVLVSGVPLRDGSPLFAGYVPDVNATIVSRILSEGGEIVGKSTCENLCFSGGSHTSYPAPVRNPKNPKYMAGGSSSGSAALVASREVEMAIGGDQAGSIRIPSSWCGVFGLKPTWGLVPYTGILGMEPVLDHAGPIANSTQNLALLLEVIAGKDGFDPRQLATPQRSPKFSEAKGKIDELTIGIVKEGFGWKDISERDVDEVVRESAKTFTELGAKVSEVSIPLHRDGISVWSGIIMEGSWHNSLRINGLEHSWAGRFDSGLVEYWSSALRKNGNKLAETAKLTALVGAFIAKTYGGAYYSIARNLRQSLIDAYDGALTEFDLLVMPTTPQKAVAFPKRMTLEQSLALTTLNLHNTCAFDVSGHPALNIPCGDSSGLPVGMMLIGRYFEEATMLRVSRAFEDRRGP